MVKGYVFSYLHEIFFVKFPIILLEWLLRLAKQKRDFWGGEPMIWTLKFIQILKGINNKISCVVDYWLDRIFVGYITKFAIETLKSYSATERDFFIGPQGRYLNSMYLCIKMLLCGKGIM